MKTFEDNMDIPAGRRTAAITRFGTYIDAGDSEYAEVQRGIALNRLARKAGWPCDTGPSMSSALLRSGTRFLAAKVDLEKAGMGDRRAMERFLTATGNLNPKPIADLWAQRQRMPANRVS